MLKKLEKFYQNYLKFLDKYASSLLLLTLRILIGTIFLKSGLTKIANFEQTVFLFEYEYNLPILAPKIAAFLASFFELFCALSLLTGFFSRISALPLIFMTLVIQFFVFQNEQHFFWLAILSTIAVFGSGKISLDFLAQIFFKKIRKKI